MIKQILTILDDYKSEIHLVEESNLSEPKNSSKGIKISRKYIQKLRILVRENDFDFIQDEIDFFKIHKPYVYGRLKFFVKIHRYTLEKPNGPTKRLKKHIEEQLNNIEERRKHYLYFEKYYLQNQTTLDKYYFVRGKDSLELISETSHYYTDPEFSTSHDNTVAQIIAVELLINHYNSELSYLRRKELHHSTKKSFLPSIDNFSWTASKTDLVELIYALQAVGAIQNGNSDIKFIASICEKVFSMDLGNFYRTYLEIRERKMDRTKFINNLKVSLENKMNQDDLKY